MRFFGFLFVLLLGQRAFASFYPSSYDESRAHFIHYSQKSVHQEISLPTIFRLSVPSRSRQDLSIDALYYPQVGSAKRRLLILSSGVHGVEAFTGSALQFSFMEKVLTPSLLKSMGVLLVHAVNPFGYAFKRRVDEDNIDLNRNLSATSDTFKKKSEDYKAFEDYLNPQASLNANLWNDIKLFLRSLIQLLKYGKKKMAQVAVGGQYQNPKGIYYGGAKNQINAPLIQSLFEEVGQDSSYILHLDLHTGYGQRGQLHLFTEERIAQLPGFTEIFSGFNIDLGEDKDFYKTSGSFSELTINTFKEKKIAIPMTFEFGTMNSQTIMGGFLSLRNMIYENQGFHYGYVDDRSREKSQQDFMEMFNPSDPKWRESIMRLGLDAFQKVTERFSKID